MRKGTALPALLLSALLGAPAAHAGQTAGRASGTTIAPGAIVVLDTAPARYTGERISLDLKDADIRDVLKVFAKLGRFNLVVDPEVRGSVTVRLENVPWDQAMDLILRMNGLGYTLEGRILRAGRPARLADP
jgi:type IV pilus assembly protein PilQ